MERMFDENGRAGMKPDERERLLEMSEVSLWIDVYDDIFSDFDHRPTVQRAISQDFLEETKRATRETVSGKIELKILVPESKRSEHEETLIKRRLKEHFKKHSIIIQKEARREFRQGVIFTIVGLILMFGAALIIFEKPESSLIASFLIVVLEPAGWFLFWEGMYSIIFESKREKPNLEFYKKMAECEISFLAY